MDKRDFANKMLNIIYLICNIQMSNILPMIVIILQLTGRSAVRCSINRTISTTNVADGCGGTLRDMTGTVTSPNHPNNYNNNLDCYYDIVGPENCTITLDVDALDFEPRFDYLEVRDIYVTRLRQILLRNVVY